MPKVHFYFNWGKVNHKFRKIFKDFAKIRIGISRTVMRHSRRLNRVYHQLYHQLYNRVTINFSLRKFRNLHPTPWRFAFNSQFDTPQLLVFKFAIWHGHGVAWHTCNFSRPKVPRITKSFKQTLDTKHNFQVSRAIIPGHRISEQIIDIQGSFLQFLDCNKIYRKYLEFLYSNFYYKN